MSNINTTGINVNYPVAGVNNSSQGFRDNFASIKSNLDTASTEINDLQSKVVLKQALTSGTVNNDMANAVISNAVFKTCRASTYNLGNALSGTVLIDVSNGDVQYGAISANSNVRLQFGNWGPAGTQSNVQLWFSVADSNSAVDFTGTNVDSSVKVLENFNATANTVTAPAGVTQLNLRLSTVDCGQTITVDPTYHGRQTVQVQQRTPSPNGVKGDVAGTVAVDANYMYVCTGSFNSTTANLNISSTAGTLITLTSPSTTASVSLNDPIVFAGANVAATGLTAGSVYYIQAIPTAGVGGTISVSASRTGGIAGATVALNTTTNAFTATSYHGNVIWKRTALGTW